MLTTLAEFFAEIGHVQGLPAHVIGVAFIGWPWIARHDPMMIAVSFLCLRPFIDLLASRGHEIRAPLFQLVGPLDRRGCEA